MISETFPVLGVEVSAVTLEEAVDAVAEAIPSDTTEHVCVCSVNMVLQSRENDALARALEDAGLVVPDGYPITQLGKLRSSSPVGRVRGADFTRALCRRAAEDGASVYFYGGAEGVPDAMVETLRDRTPDLDVAGTRSPPFQRQTAEEIQDDLQAINDADPDIVFVGLGCPKQERWMQEHRERLDASVLVGIGAAFDFIAGTKHEAPRVVQKVGLEWMWRFGQEPQRLWRRVVVEGPKFAALMVRELLKRDAVGSAQTSDETEGAPK